ncbi:hypothetical protein BDV38DRAFT_247867, partial [Aspergillus pseudotamarii]
MDLFAFRYGVKALCSLWYVQNPLLRDSVRKSGVDRQKNPIQCCCSRTTRSMSGYFEASEGQSGPVWTAYRHRPQTFRPPPWSLVRLRSTMVMVSSATGDFGEKDDLHHPYSIPYRRGSRSQLSQSHVRLGGLGRRCHVEHGRSTIEKERNAVLFVHQSCPVCLMVCFPRRRTSCSQIECCFVPISVNSFAI